MGENLLEIKTKRRSQAFHNSVTNVINVVGKSISSITMWNNVNQLRKHDFSCEAVVNKLKDRKLFLIK